MTLGRTKTLWLVGMVGIIAVIGSGCADREHIRDDFGQRVRLFQWKQRVYAQAAGGGSTGLDSEEAAVIHTSYRSGLAGKAGGGGQQPEQRVMVLGDAPHGEPK